MSDLTEVVAYSVALSVCFGVVVYAIRQYVVGSMRRLAEENRDLKQEIERLRAAFDTVQRENKELRCQVDKLELQVKHLGELADIQRNDLADWYAASKAQRQP